MKKFFRNAKFFIGLALQTMIAIAVFAVGWSMSFTSIDINQTPGVSGKVTSISIRQVRGTHAIPGQTECDIYLAGSDAGFWIYRRSNNYQDILSELTQGTQVTIYHSNTVDSNNDCYTAYQVNSGNKIIYSKGEYEGKEKLAGRFIVLPGSLLLLGTVVYQVRKRRRANSSLYTP